MHASCCNLSAECVAGSHEVLLLDGLFLHAPALEGCFDLTIFVASDFETCLTRALARNQEGSTDPTELEAVYRERYIPGFQLYCEQVMPEQKASIIVRT